MTDLMALLQTMVNANAVDPQIVNDYYEEFVEPLDDEEDRGLAFYVSDKGFNEWLDTFSDDDAAQLLGFADIAAAAENQDTKTVTDWLTENWRAVALMLFHVDDQEARTEYVSSLLGLNKEVTARLTRFSAVDADVQHELAVFAEHMADKGLVLDVANATYDAVKKQLHWDIAYQPLTSELLAAVNKMDLDQHLTDYDLTVNNELAQRFADVGIAGTAVFTPDGSTVRELTIDTDVLLAGVDYAVDMNWLTPSQGKAVAQELTQTLIDLRDRIADMISREGTWLLSRLMM